MENAVNSNSVTARIPDNGVPPKISFELKKLSNINVEEVVIFLVIGRKKALTYNTIDINNIDTTISFLLFKLFKIRDLINHRLCLFYNSNL